MNKIFKIVKNANGNNTVASELAKGVRKGSLSAISLALLSISAPTLAGQVAILGTATSENAVSVGSNSYATAVDGVANGQGSIATGQGFTREEFAEKLAENKAATDAVKAAQDKLDGTNAGIEAADNAINTLGNQIDALTNKQQAIADKLRAKDGLDNLKAGKEAQLAEQGTALDNASAELEKIKRDGKNTYLNFTDELNQLNWSALNGQDSGRNTVSAELKARIEEKFPEIATKYNDAKYRGIVDGYINRQAQYQGSYESLATNPYSGVLGFNRNTVLNTWYFKSSLDQTNYTLNKSSDGYKLRNIVNIYENNAKIGESSSLNTVWLGEVSASRADRFISTNGTLSNHNIYDNRYWNNITPTNDTQESDYNSLILMSLSVQKSIQNNEFTPLRGIVKYFDMVRDSSNLTIDGKEFNSEYNSWIKNRYADNAIVFDLKSTGNNSDPNLNRISAHFYDYNIPVLTKIKDMTVNNQNLITTKNINNFKSFYAELQDRYNQIDWTYADSVYDLVAYRKSLDKVVAYNAKINTVLDLYQKIINERKKDNANQANIETWTQELMTVKQEVLNGVQDKTNFGMGMDLVLKQDKADQFLYYADAEAQRTIARINSELKLYDDKDQLVVDVVSKAKELQKAYDDAKKAKDGTQAELDKLNKQIADLELTEDERQTDDLKKAKQKELEDARAEKARLEDQIGKDQEALDQARANLNNTNLRDLGLRSQAHGSDAYASGNDSIAMGTSSTATGNDSIAIGRLSTVTSEKGIALGAENVVRGQNSVAIGTKNSVSGENTFVLGSNVTSDVANSVALGADTTLAAPIATKSIDIQGETYNFAGTVPVGTVSVGSKDKERTITNVAAGRISATSTDAINGSQLYAVTEAVNNLKLLDMDTINAGLNGKINLTDPNGTTTSIGFGDTLNLAGDENIDVKVDPNTQKATIALKTIRQYSFTTNGNADETATTWDFSKNNGVNFNAGAGLKVWTDKQGTITYDLSDATKEAINNAGAKDSITGLVFEADKGATPKLDTIVKVNGDDSITTSASNTGLKIALKDDVVVNSSVKVGDVTIKKDGTVTGVKDGELSPTSRDAVNGSQLYTTNQNVAGNTAQINVNKGAIAENKAQIAANKAEIDKGFNTRTDDGKVVNRKLGSTVGVVGDRNIVTTTNSNGDVKVGLSRHVVVDKVSTGDVSISNEGVNAGGKRVTNVANGEISPTSRDAVNGSQLHQTQQQIVRMGDTINNLNNRVSNVEQKVNKVDKRRKGAAASSLATAGLLQSHKAGQSGVTAAAGQYQGQTAVAVGYTRLSDNGKIGIKLSGTANTQGEVGGTVGVGYFW